MEKLAIPLGVTWILGCLVVGFIFLGRVPASAKVSVPPKATLSPQKPKPSIAPKVNPNVLTKDSVKTKVKLEGASDDMTVTQVQVKNR